MILTSFLKYAIAGFNCIQYCCPSLCLSPPVCFLDDDDNNNNDSPSVFHLAGGSSPLDSPFSLPSKVAQAEFPRQNSCVEFPTRSTSRHKKTGEIKKQREKEGEKARLKAKERLVLNWFGLFFTLSPQCKTPL